MRHRAPVGIPRKWTGRILGAGGTDGRFTGLLRAGWHFFACLGRRQALVSHPRRPGLFIEDFCSRAAQSYAKCRAMAGQGSSTRNRRMPGAYAPWPSTERRFAVTRTARPTSRSSKARPATTRSSSTPLTCWNWAGSTFGSSPWRSAGAGSSHDLLGPDRYRCPRCSDTGAPESATSHAGGELAASKVPWDKPGARRAPTQPAHSSSPLAPAGRFRAPPQNRWRWPETKSSAAD